MGGSIAVFLLVLLLFCGGVDGLGPSRPAKSHFARSVATPQMQMPQPWDAPRALRTALFFNSPAQVQSRMGLGLSKPTRPDGLVWSAERPDLATWGPLDDVVSRHPLAMLQWTREQPANRPTCARWQWEHLS